MCIHYDLLYGYEWRKHKSEYIHLIDAIITLKHKKNYTMKHNVLQQLHSNITTNYTRVIIPSFCDTTY